MSGTQIDLVVIPLLALLAPIVVRLLRRFVPVPVVVVEVVLGVACGPAALGLVRQTSFLQLFGHIGSMLLFFLAGSEIDFAAISGRPLRRAVWGWLLSFAVALPLGLLAVGGGRGGVVIAIALSSTALGVLLPILRDAGILRSALGRATTATGTVGEFGPLLAMAFLLSPKPLGATVVVLAVFAVVCAAAILLVRRRPPRRLLHLIEETQHNTSQVATRFVVASMAVFIGLDVVLGLDPLLGAFAAGVVFRLILQQAPDRVAELVESKLQAIGFGLLIPVFFIATGVNLDIRSLVGSPRALAVMALTLVALVVVRGLPSLIGAPAGVDVRQRLATGMFGATGLPVVVAVTSLGVSDRLISGGLAAALVGAAMLSVLIFPVIGLFLGDGARPEDDTASTWRRDEIFVPDVG